MARLLPNWRNGNCALPRAALMRAALACLLASAAVRAEEPPPEPHDGRDKDPDRFLWEGETGRGFRKGAWLGGAMTGTGFGMRRFGGKTRHDLVFFSAQAGRMMTGLVGEDSILSGNLELFGMGFGGHQHHPSSGSLAGLAGGLRYHVSTGTRWVPFVMGGAGVMATDIKEPDLSTVFQFNEQFGAGLNWFVREDLALTLEYRFIHISNAGIRDPNNGVNTSLFLAGLTWGF